MKHKLTIFIMNFNWLDWPKKQAEYYSDCGHTVIIVDNMSTYPPLLDWYKYCPYKVISTKGATLSCQNRFIWEMGLEHTVNGNYYAVTDADLGVEGVPKDFADVLIADIERNPSIIKSGFSLEVRDLPRNVYANIYRDGEKNNYARPDVYGFCNVAIDTTFAVYSKDRCNNLDKLWRKEGEEAPSSFLDDRYFYRAHRAPFPYTAKHMPWYLDFKNLNKEQAYAVWDAEYGSLHTFKKLYENELKARYGI